MKIRQEVEISPDFVCHAPSCFCPASPESNEGKFNIIFGDNGKGE